MKLPRGLAAELGKWFAEVATPIPRERITLNGTTDPVVRYAPSV